MEVIIAALLQRLAASQESSSTDYERISSEQILSLFESGKEDEKQ